MRAIWAMGMLLLVLGCGSKSGNQASADPTVPPASQIGTQGAARLLTQGTFGPTLDEIHATAVQSYDQWFATQAAAEPSFILDQVPQSNSDRLLPWWTVAVNSPDQLRQRMAFALSQIFVVSGASGLENQGVASYSDLLVAHSLGNFRDLLDAVSRSPVMGQYLSFFRNDKANPLTGSHADENYARELMQLFTVGLVMLNPDGTVKTDAAGNPIPAYGLPEVENLARVFTGWASNPIPPSKVGDENAWRYELDDLNPMAPYEAHHDTGAKTLIGGVVIPAGGTCESDLKVALDTLFQHPNVGPFIGRKLIQRLVTSNPSPAYLSRVSATFADDGTGVRGNLELIRKLLQPAASRSRLQRDGGAPGSSPLSSRIEPVAFGNA